MQLKRDKDSHKGSNGVVLVIGGSNLYTGSPALCAMAALRIGADLAYVAAPERAADACAHFSPDLITISLEGECLVPSHFEDIKPFLEKVDVVVMGPGLGLNKNTEAAVRTILREVSSPLVLDADALKMIVPDLEVLKERNVILTPHRKEFELLTGKPASEEAAKEFALERGVCMVLKAPEDIITDGHDVELNKTGNEGMTIGGTGDVLSGVIAGLLAQAHEPFEAAKLGTKVNGIAGDLCKAEKGYGFTASDLLDKLPEALKKA